LAATLSPDAPGATPGGIQEHLCSWIIIIIHTPKEYRDILFDNNYNKYWRIRTKDWRIPAARIKGGLRNTAP